MDSQNNCESHDMPFTLRLNLAKMEIVFVFDPEVGDIHSLNWIIKIDQLGIILSWNDVTKAFFLQCKLVGLANMWYNCLIY